jgi:hypothetical protein
MGLNGWIPVGGQVDPISIVGESLLLKNAQNNDSKKRISEMINRIIPHRTPFVTILYFCVYSLINSFTRDPSRHHCIMVITVMIAPQV